MDFLFDLLFLSGWSSFQELQAKENTFLYYHSDSSYMYCFKTSKGNVLKSLFFVVVQTIRTVKISSESPAPIYGEYPHYWFCSNIYIFDESYRRPKSMINLLYSCLITSSDRFIKINSLCTINTVQSFQEYVVTILVVLIYTHRTEEYDDIIGSYFLHHTIGNRYSLRLKKNKLMNGWFCH